MVSVGTRLLTPVAAGVLVETGPSGGEVGEVPLAVLSGLCAGARGGSIGAVLDVIGV